MDLQPFLKHMSPKWHMDCHGFVQYCQGAMRGWLTKDQCWRAHAEKKLPADAQ